MTAENISAPLLPRLSIGLAVYNGEQYLAPALDSLLAQTFTDYELIICDNASTDRTQDICARYAAKDSRIRYFREPSNTGAVRNHNRTIELARGEYFKWASHDDVYAPTFVERCVAHLDSHPETVLAFTKSQFINSGGALLDEYPHPLEFANRSRAERFLGYAFASHTMVEDYGVVRLEVLRRTPLLGNFVWSDMVLFGELSLHGPFFEIPEILYFRREHPKRAMQSNRDAKSLSVWNDPRKSAGQVAPAWKVLAEHFATLARVPLPLGERFLLAIGTIRRGLWTHRLAGELGDLIQFTLRGR